MSPDYIIGIAALPRSGKDTTTTILNTIFAGRAHTLSSGIIVEGLLKNLGVPNYMDRVAKQQGFIELARRFGNEWLLTALGNEWRMSGKKIWIFNGVCMPWDATYIQSFDRWMLLCITAPFETRLARARQAVLNKETTAKPDEAAMTEERFREIHTHETARHIESFQTIPGASIITNIGTVRELGSQIATALLTKDIVDQEELIASRDRLEALYKKLESSE